MKLYSRILDRGGYLPKKYTCDGEGVSPPLIIEDVPRETKSLVLIMKDPDAPLKTFIHWILFNIPPDLNVIEENEDRFNMGRNSLFKVGYLPPCPPKSEHRYIFELYALDKDLYLKDGVGVRRILKEIKGNTLDKSELITLYKRKR